MTVLETMKERRAGIKAELDALLQTVSDEKRDLTDDEDAVFGEKSAELRKADERIAELQEQEIREARAAAHRVETGESRQTASLNGITEPKQYRKDNSVEVSFFRDLYNSRKGDATAAERLHRHMAQIRETRALSTTAGAGGELAPPEWMVDQYVKFARAGRKFADSLDPMPLPSGVSSINLPRLTGGTTAAVQAGQNSSVSDTDLTTDSVSSGITTVAGKGVVSMQLLEQSGMPFDQLIGQDLMSAHAAAFDTQVISGSAASGQLNGVYTYFAASGTVNVTWTQASPAVGGAGGFYAQIFSAASKIETALFKAPDTIWMHPRRWNWILSSSDTSNRPLVTPSGVAFNPVAVSDGVGAAEGVVGMIGDLQVITDANIPTNLGTGTNQDPILVGRRSELRLWESELKADSFDAPYADSMGVLFRVYNYSAAIPDRRTTSVAIINGTGSIAPTF